jgi:hypothetical protein
MAKSNLDRFCGVFQVANSFRSPPGVLPCGLVYHTPLGRDPILEILRPRERPRWRLGELAFLR